MSANRLGGGVVLWSVGYSCGETATPRAMQNWIMRVGVCCWCKRCGCTVGGDVSCLICKVECGGRPSSLLAGCPWFGHVRGGMSIVCGIRSERSL